MSPVIAIDGPSGVGKGTVGRVVAQTLECVYVDTGAMYRAVAWKTKHQGFDLDDENVVIEVAIRAVFDLSTARVFIDGHDVTQTIRTPEMDAAAATVARMPRVRQALVAHQREYASNWTVVMEGRDIGTVVFPKAEVKIYLDASAEERAARRSKDPAHRWSKGAELGEVARALEARDRSDRTRQVSPLMRAPDAVSIDTTGVPIAEVVRRVLEIVKEKLGE